MTDREITRFLRAKHTHTTPRQVRGYKLRSRYGRNWDRLTSEVRRTREKLDILQDFQCEWEQRMIADFVAAKEGTK
jgi:hypothetical protein